MAFCFAVLLLVIPEVNAAWENMEVLRYDFEIESDNPREQWYPWVEYNSMDNEFMTVWHAAGPLREDCASGDDSECTTKLHSVNGRRVSIDGVLLGDTIQLSPPEAGYKTDVRCAYNKFTNEYMTISAESPTLKALDTEKLIARINARGEIQYGPNILHPTGHGESPLPIIVFNSVRREYLVVYSDRNIYNKHLNLIGFILDENGDRIQGPFPVGNQLGDYYAPRAAYNPTDDTYLVVWEDFRNVPDWLSPCDIYGALLDFEGKMIKEIPVLDDHALGEPDAGDQRVPVVAYNPDKNKFFVVWEADEMPTIDDGAIFARYVNGDGTLEPVITLVDEPRRQHWPDVKYIQEEKKYFMVWNDARNDGLAPGIGWWESPAIDVYGRWLDDSGTPIGEEILIAENKDTVGWKQVPIIAYSPVEQRFLIAWYDRRASGGDTMFGGAPSDVRATLYGLPSFLTVRVVDNGGESNPLQGARVLVMGPAVPIMGETNEGGWFNIPKGSQTNGPYLVLVIKTGYRMALQLVNYTGSALQETIQLKKVR